MLEARGIEKRNNEKHGNELVNDGSAHGANNQLLKDSRCSELVKEKAAETPISADFQPSKG